MTKPDSSIRSEDHKLPFKYKGIHEPKGRVKGFRVEIRPPNSNQKIWVGTFDTRDKAMRAFDAAVYLTGKDPYYFVYPANYFPPRPSKPPRTHVQSVAKKFAEKTDDVKVNPTSCLVDISRVSSVNSSAVGNEQQITPVAPDVKVVEKLDTKETELAAFDRGYHAKDLDFISLFLGQVPPEDILPCIEGEYTSFIPEYPPSRPLAKRKRDTAVGVNIVAENRTSVGLAESDFNFVDDWFIDFLDGDWPLETSPSDFDTDELVR